MSLIVAAVATGVGIMVTKASAKAMVPTMEAAVSGIASTVSGSGGWL